MAEATQTGLCALGLRLAYGPETVVDDLTLSIAPGRFTAILGPNGCGKSTLLRALAGLQPCQRGHVALDGTPITRFGAKALARRISILAQGAVPPEGLTVDDLVRQGRYPHRGLLGGWTAEDALAVDRALALTGTAHLAQRPLAALSGGQRQRAWIAMTLAQQAPILLLDEPTTFLDPAHQLEVLALIRRLVSDGGATVIAVLHDLNQAANHADHVVLLKDGALMAEGAPGAVMTPDTLARVFGISVSILADPETGAPICIPRTAQTGDATESDP